ncbi:MAG: PAS domain S-box protein, partial [Reyranellaceae bacterium]
MSVSRQLGFWMVGLVLVTAAAVGLVSYLSIEDSLSAGEVEELRGDVRLVAARLEAAMDGARGDIATFADLPSVEDLIRTADNPAEAARARSRVTGYIAALLAAKPQYAKLRVIDVRGREIVRVDRGGTGGSVRAVPPPDLRDTSGRDFMAASTMTMGDIFVSQPNLNVENGAIESPRVPTVRLATPLFDERGRRFGIVVLHVDLRPAFAEVRAAGTPPTQLHVVNEAGDYLVHPDPAMEFAFQSGTPRRVQDRFPGLARVLRERTAIAQLIDDDTGQPVALAAGPARLAGGPYIFVVATVPQADLVAPARVVRNTALLAGMAAALAAALLALWLARSLATPLKQMTAAVSAFVPGSAMSLPTQSGGEFGVLARAFERMALDVSRKTAALREEIASHLRTEDQRAALAERDRLMSAAVQSSNDAIVTATLDSTITSWNPAAERTYGYRAEEVIGKNGGFLVPPEIEPLKQEIYARIRRGEAIEPFETVLLRQDGKRINISFSPSPIRDDSGTVVGVCITSRDITEAQATRERLKH